MSTILIVDDQPSVLAALRQCFALEPDLQIIGDADNGLSALSLAQTLHPDIILTDLKMPIMDGLTATIELGKIEPKIKVIILSIYDDKSTRAQALSAGAFDFVRKHDPAEVLLAAVRRAGDIESSTIH